MTPWVISSCANTALAASMWSVRKQWLVQTSASTRFVAPLAERHDKQKKQINRKCLYENCVHDGNTKQPHPSDHVSTRLPGDPGSSFVLTPPRQPWDHVYLHPGSWITAPAAMHHRSWIHASWPHASWTHESWMLVWELQTFACINTCIHTHTHKRQTCKHSFIPSFVHAFP